jgi:hypothetical protein
MPISSGAQCDKLGHSAIPEQVGPDMPAEGVPSTGLDLLPDRRTAHEPTVPIEPQMTADTGLVLPIEIDCKRAPVDLEPVGHLEKPLADEGWA